MPKYRTFAFTDKIYDKLAPARLSENEAIVKLQALIRSDKPFMVSRFGSTELQALSYIKYYPFLLPLKRRTFYNIQYMSGFFPVTYDNLKRFYGLYKEDVKQLDVLVSWRVEELFFQNWIDKLTFIGKPTIDEFYRQENPWTTALKGKKVLVVHPFAETIEEQYKKRNLLFKNKDTLPEFSSLTTVKAVQSIAANPVDLKDWFEALNWMKSEIDGKDYEVAILGCGAYGMPLAAHIKRMGKQAIHLGGVTQFLFGITGKRYDENDAYKYYINEHFVYPPASDKPKSAKAVEGGCYW